MRTCKAHLSPVGFATFSFSGEKMLWLEEPICKLVSLNTKKGHQKTQGKGTDHLGLNNAIGFACFSHPIPIPLGQIAELVCLFDLLWKELMSKEGLVN